MRIASGDKPLSSVLKDAKESAVVKLEEEIPSRFYLEYESEKQGFELSVP